MQSKNPGLPAPQPCLHRLAGSWEEDWLFGVMKGGDELSTGRRESWMEKQDHLILGSMFLTRGKQATSNLFKVNK